MATEKNTCYWGFEAEAAINDYRIVQAGTNENQVKVADGPTNNIIGVLKPRTDGNTVAAGDSVDVYAIGAIGKVEADGSTDAIARGDLLTANASGKAVKSENPGIDNIIGRAEEACTADGDIISYIVLPQSNYNQNGLKVRKIAISYADGTTENDTGFDLPAKAVVVDAFVDVLTVEATGGTKTIDVGTDGSGSNDPDGFLDGISVATTTGLRKGTLASGGQTKGALLRADEGGTGELVPESDITSGGESVTWTPGSNDFAELVAELYIVYYELGN